MPSQRFMARYAVDARSDETKALQLVLNDRHSQLSQLKTGLAGGMNMIHELRGLQLVPESLNIENHDLVSRLEAFAEPTIEVTADAIEQTQNLITQIALQL